jgi:hypothetical protein
MIGGFSPFYHENPMKMYQGITEGKINWPKNITKITKHLLGTIFVMEPNLRPSISEIKNHQFFNGLDWSLAETGGLDPPYKPDISNLSRNFSTKQ